MVMTKLTLISPGILQSMAVRCAFSEYPTLSKSQGKCLILKIGTRKKKRQNTEVYKYFFFSKPQDCLDLQLNALRLLRDKKFPKMQKKQLHKHIQVSLIIRHKPHEDLQKVFFFVCEVLQCPVLSITGPQTPFPEYRCRSAGNRTWTIRSDSLLTAR